MSDDPQRFVSHVARVAVPGGRASAPPPSEARTRMLEAPSEPPRTANRPSDFYPLEPRNLADLGTEASGLEGLLLRVLLGLRAETGRRLAEQLCVPLTIVRDLLDAGKEKKLVNYRGTTVMGDMVAELTELGREKALESKQITSYVGPAPVPWGHYREALQHQSLSKCRPRPTDLERAFADLQISDDLFDRIGPAVSSGRPLFLFGEPGNGKTSLAERMTRCFGGAVWIPHALDIGGHIVKLFDPAIHVEVPVDHGSLKSRADRRWIYVERPTVIAGGELTLEMLEIHFDAHHGIGEAPLQVKANLGTLVIDDFGRGHTQPRELLNRWILPLERRVDFLTLPDGRKFDVPFDCMLVFSTNLEPRDLADEAYLRRIPYKVYVGDPVEHEFEKLVESVAVRLGVQVQPRSVKYLIERHYKADKRPMRFCHPRDLLAQVVHLCSYEGRPAVAGPAEWDRVVANYFGV